MSSPKPPPPRAAPETDATYERTNPDTVLPREQAGRSTRPDAEAVKKASAGTAPPEHQQAPPIRQQRQHRRQQQQASVGKSAGMSSEQSNAARPTPLPPGGKIAGDMKTEELQGWDQAPTDIRNPREQRHPRPDGVGGSEPDSAKRDPQR